MVRATFYDVLGVPATAPPERLREAFRELALRHHPDRVVHLDAAARRAAERTMQEVTEAFAVLRHDERRRLYDRCLAEGLDYALESARSSSSSAAADELATLAALEDLALRVRLAVAALPGAPKMDARADHEVFDWVMEGRAPGARYRVFIKAFDDLVPDALAALPSALTDVDTASGVLTRSYQGIVLAARRVTAAPAARELVEAFNARMTRLRRGETITGMVLLRTDRDRPFVPYAEYLRPDFSALTLPPA